MDVKLVISKYWQELGVSLNKVTKSFIWFFLTFLIGMVPVGLFWLVESRQGRIPSFEELILHGDAFAFSIVLVSSLVWDYVIFEDRDKLHFTEAFIFYGIPLITIPFSAAVYGFCLEGNPQPPELIALFEFWILALTAIYAILTKLKAC
jgi:hypothetical protein